MRKKINLFSVSLILSLVLHSQLFAQDDSLRIIKYKYEFEQRKTISKSYSIVPTDLIEFSNRFGKIIIHPWNKTEIKVDVEFKTTAKTEAWAKSVLNDIDLETNKTNGHVIFKSLFVYDLDKKEGSKPGQQRLDKYKGKNTSQSLEVNYDVYMPVINPLKITNMLGAIVIPDYKGLVDLESQNGILITGNLAKIKNIKVSSGKATFESLSNCSLKIDNSTIDFKRLIGNIKMDIVFCKGLKINLENSLKKLEIVESYSTINLRPAANFSAKYFMSTNYCDFLNRTNLVFPSIGDDNRRKYTGKTGNGSGIINVKANFGKLIIGEATENDMENLK